MSTTPPPSQWRQGQPDWQNQPPEPAQPSYPPPPPQDQVGYGYPQQRGMPPAAGPEYASWWRRVAAIILDGLIVGIPLSIIGVALGLIDTSTDELETGFSFQAGPGWLALSLIVPLLYYGLLEGGARMASVGKMALGIQVRDADSGGPIGFGKAVLRRFIYNVLWYLLFIPGLINGLSPLWDARKQAWHDKAVNSVVVRA